MKKLGVCLLVCLFLVVGSMAGVGHVAAASLGGDDVSIRAVAGDSCTILIDWHDPYWDPYWEE